jgi:hypothetical protein
MTQFWSCSGVERPMKRIFPSAWSFRRVSKGLGLRFQARVQVWSWRRSIRSVPRLLRRSSTFARRVL